MIFFPVPEHESLVLNLKHAPICILVSLILIVCFLLSKPFDQNALANLPVEERSVFWQVQGEAYTRYLIDNKIVLGSLVKQLVLDKKKPESSKKILGYLSLRDSKFFPYEEWYAKQGDLVKYEFWKSIQKIRNKSFFEKILLSYGINYDSFAETTVFTYMFLHASTGHLIANLLFLLLFGVAVEKRFGSIMFLSLFLLGGVMGAFFYFSLNGLSMVSLIGASGSVSALVAFYSFYLLHEKTSFFYFLLPFEGYFGFISLPAVGIVIWWALYELANHYSSAGIYGSVAHSAHLGGFTLGVLAASILRLTQNFLVGQEKNPALQDSLSSL